MANRTNMWKRLIRHTGLALLVGSLLAACNLGQQAPPEPVEEQLLTPGVIVPQQEEGGVAPEAPTATPLIQVPPTATPTPELLPWEQIQSITVDGTTHRTQEPVTVRVKRGRAVSTMTCSWVLQDTGQTGALGTPTSTQLDENTFEDVYIFTPQQAGTYSVNCTGIATTTSGQRQVSAVGTPFTVEAKG